MALTNCAPRPFRVPGAAVPGAAVAGAAEPGTVAPAYAPAPSLVPVALSTTSERCACSGSTVTVDSLYSAYPFAWKLNDHTPGGRSAKENTPSRPAIAA